MSDHVDLDSLSRDDEVLATMAATGVDRARAEFMVAIRRGELDGDVSYEA